MDTLRQLKDYIMCATTLGATPGESASIFWHETKNFRARLNLARHRPEKIYSVQTTFGQLFFRDNFGDITNLVNLLYRREYEITRLEHPGVILDVGANIGLAAVWFDNYNPERDIFCFEPLPRSAGLIRSNCPRAKVFEVAVGAKEGKVTLRVDRDQVMASSIPCLWKTEEQEFPMITLDDFAAQEKFKEVALLKMDVEGMEVEILKGARTLLGRTHQAVIETHSAALHQETVRCLEEAGLDIAYERLKKDTSLLFATRKSL